MTQNSDKLVKMNFLLPKKVPKRDEKKLQKNKLKDFYKHIIRAIIKFKNILLRCELGLASFPKPRYSGFSIAQKYLLPSFGFNPRPNNVSKMLESESVVICAVIANISDAKLAYG